MYLEFVFVLVHQTYDNDYEHYNLKCEVDVCLKECSGSKDSCQSDSPKTILYNKHTALNC